jgi:predicted nuclease of restriction endonuclease-like (RecB) superfamily
VNAELVGLYWQVGEHISRKIESAEWGAGVVDALAAHIAKTQPGLRGFTRRNLFRMRQFYETYRDDEIGSPLVSQLPWTHHLIILTQAKRPEEREFYVRVAIAERWTKRELEWQFAGGLFARTVLRPPKMSTAFVETHPGAATVLRDAYVVEFLGLPEEHSEADLHGALLRHLTWFLVGATPRRRVGTGPSWGASRAPCRTNRERACGSRGSAGRPTA